MLTAPFGYFDCPVCVDLYLLPDWNVKSMPLLSRVHGGTGRTRGAESTTARTTAGFAIGTASSSHDGAPHSQRMPGPVELAVCAVDQRSGARVAVAKVRCAGFGVDGGTLFAGLGSDPAEAGATSVRTKSDGGAEVAGGRISIDSSTSTTV
jgi:hypothetical protein